MNNSDIIRPETPFNIMGVHGRLFTLRRPPAPWVSGVFANQKWISESRKVKGYGSGAVMHVNLRFDDNCKNGRMSFAITADIYIPGRKDVEACGCLHTEITSYFPELAPLIQWHLFDTSGPLHYVANTVYLAGDRDCNGWRVGEPSEFAYGYRFGSSPVVCRVKYPFFKFIESRRAEKAGEFSVTSIAYAGRSDYKFDPKFTIVGFAEKWHDCPFDDKTSADEFCLALNTCEVFPTRTPVRFSEGKPREFDAARRAANWPDATDAELSAPPEDLKVALLARLPAMLAEFRRAMESCGFLWSCDGGAK